MIVGERNAVRRCILVIIAPVLACTWLACSSEAGGDPDPSNTDGGPESDSSTQGDGTALRDAGGKGDGADPHKCSVVPGAVQRLDNCYWAQHEPLTFEFANARCQRLDAKDHVVTISSAAENTFVASSLAMGEERWIGLWAVTHGHAPPRVVDFFWKDTTPDTFRAWAPGFPTGSGRCVIMRSDGLWENRACTETHAVVCERE
jgi:hypothetical protein